MDKQTHTLTQTHTRLSKNGPVKQVENHHTGDFPKRSWRDRSVYLCVLGWGGWLQPFVVLKYQHCTNIHLNKIKTPKFQESYSAHCGLCKKGQRFSVMLTEATLDFVTCLEGWRWHQICVSRSVCVQEHLIGCPCPLTLLLLLPWPTVHRVTCDSLNNLLSDCKTIHKCVSVIHRAIWRTICKTICRVFCRTICRTILKCVSVIRKTIHRTIHRRFCSVIRKMIRKCVSVIHITTVHTAFHRTVRRTIRTVIRRMIRSCVEKGYGPAGYWGVIVAKLFANVYLSVFVCTQDLCCVC